MKTFVLFFSISLTLFQVDSFEYHEEYSTEDIDGRALEEYYRQLGEPYVYDIPQESYPLYIPSENYPSNVIPNEASVKPVDTFAPEVTSTTTPAPEQTTKQTNKPYYDLKDAPELFNKFMKDFEKKYKDEEERNKRYQNFVKNLEEINRLNKEQDATFDINMFADLGEGEPVIG